MKDGKAERARLARLVVRDWREGLSVSEIHERRGLSRGRIYRMLGDERNGSRRFSSEGREYREARDERFVWGWNAGRAASDMADEYEVSIPIVYRALREARDRGELSRPLRKAEYHSQARNLALVNDWQAGYSVSQLAYKYGLTADYCGDIVRKARRIYGDRIRTTRRMRQISARKERVRYERHARAL